MSEKQVFIVGTGRSGTSVIQEILGKHSEIYNFKKELRFISDRGGLIDLRNHMTRDWNFQNASEAVSEFRNLMIRDLFHTSRINRYISHIAKKRFGSTWMRYSSVNFKQLMSKEHFFNCIDNFINQITVDHVPGNWVGSPSFQLNSKFYITRRLNKHEFDEAAGQFLDRLLSYPMEKAGKRYWCEDSPTNLFNADVIASILPDAKIVHMFRNPMDVVASYAGKRIQWASSNPRDSAIWIRDTLLRWQEIKQSIPEHQLIEVRYEDLVSDQKRGLKRVMDFLGLEYESALDNIELRTDAIGRYKKDFSPTQLKDIYEVLLPLLQFYEYDTQIQEL